jgi:hypothetical protein
VNGETREALRRAVSARRRQVAGKLGPKPVNLDEAAYDAARGDPYLAVDIAITAWQQAGKLPELGETTIPAMRAQAPASSSG